MKALVTLLGTIGLTFTNANSFLNINNSPIKCNPPNFFSFHFE